MARLFRNVKTDNQPRLLGAQTYASDLHAIVVPALGALLATRVAPVMLNVRFWPKSFGGDGALDLGT
jgi:hypothetical protein